MSQTKQEAAEQYGKSLEIDRVRFSSGEIEAMREEATRDFIAGAEWAELKWIPVTERLPDNAGECFCIEKHEHTHVDEFERPIYKYRIIIHYWINDVRIWARSIGEKDKDIIAWCAIPNSLLNIKP